MQHRTPPPPPLFKPTLARTPQRMTVAVASSRRPTLDEGYTEDFEMPDEDDVADRIGEHIVENMIEQFGLSHVLSMVDGNIEDHIEALFQATPMLDKYFWAYYNQDRCAKWPLRGGPAGGGGGGGGGGGAGVLSSATNPIGAFAASM